MSSTLLSNNNIQTKQIMNGEDYSSLFLFCRVLLNKF